MAEDYIDYIEIDLDTHDNELFVSDFLTARSGVCVLHWALNEEPLEGFKRINN
jgi:hypothetical protein